MKKLVFIVIAVIACNFVSFSQTTDKKNNAFLELWVIYKTTTTPHETLISPVMKMDIGNDRASNPTDFTFGPTGNTNDNKEGTLILKETNGTQKSFSNEVDLFRYLYSNGWELINTENITVASVNYIRYIFTKNSTTVTSGK